MINARYSCACMRRELILYYSNDFPVSVWRGSGILSVCWIKRSGYTFSSRLNVNIIQCSTYLHPIHEL